MALKAVSVRVVAPIPGKAAVGIEIPNIKRELVSLKGVLESEIFSLAVAALTIALGKDITGQAFVTNLGKMPHFAHRGRYGDRQKRVYQYPFGQSALQKHARGVKTPADRSQEDRTQQLRRHPPLIHPVVTDAKMATRALRWAVEEMELRYKLLADKNVRNIESYNRILARENPKKQKMLKRNWKPAS